MTSEQIKKRYQDDDKEVQSYMSGLLQKLERDYGAIDESWLIQLDMVCDWYSMYVDAVRNLRTEGVCLTNPRGKTETNPNFKVMDISTKQINQILRTFATDPVAKARMTYLQQRQCTVVNEEEMLDDLLT